MGVGGIQHGASAATHDELPLTAPRGRVDHFLPDRHLEELAAGMLGYARDFNDERGLDAVHQGSPDDRLADHGIQKPAGGGLTGRIGVHLGGEVRHDVRGCHAGNRHRPEVPSRSRRQRENGASEIREEYLGVHAVDAELTVMRRERGGGHGRLNAGQRLRGTHDRHRLKGHRVVGRVLEPDRARCGIVETRQRCVGEPIDGRDIAHPHGHVVSRLRTVIERNSRLQIQPVADDLKKAGVGAEQGERVGADAVVGERQRRHSRPA